MMGPVGLPQPVRARLYAALVAAVNDSQVAKAAVAAGLEEGLLPGDEFRTFLEYDIAMWSEVVRHAKLPLDQKPED